MKKIFKILFFSIFLLALICASFLVGTYIQVSREAAQLINRGAIENVILSESPVYYDDGKTTIGVYFEKIHGKYIKYRDVPKDFIKAIIASEDGHFFDHPGFDVRAILRAFIQNIRTGKVVQGGSTITQQTAKNIFKREKRTYMAKLRELIQAMLLERMYTKEEILEMYINQFFVTGFGKGLMVAAEYFFDKDARDLDLVESAFIAGMVKGPNKYNPFTKKTDEEKREAMRAAKIRKDYVLKNMRALNLITEKQYEAAIEKQVPFKEGKVTYRLNVVLDYIREQLESEYFRKILHDQGIDNIATSGIKIYTSINRDMQEGAEESLIRHLPLLDIRLSGYDPDLFQERYVRTMGPVSENPDSYLPFFCRITGMDRNKKDPRISVAWDDGQGVIDFEGLRQMGEAWLKWKLGEWALFDNRHVLDFLKIFHEGDLIPVRLEKDPFNNGERRLVLWEIPDLEGGVVVLKKGMVKAMAGGFFNRHFNRAADAKRQLGSIFKPLVYTAALRLKWNILDPLINERDLFRFENTFYVPRPDHEPRSDKVSMAWAGTKSENLATVYLLYHLTDRLNMSEFREVAGGLGLTREKGESYEDYVERIRDRHGVVVDREALMEAAFEQAKRDIKSDLIFSGHEDVLDNLDRLHYDIDRTELDLTDEYESQIARLSFKRLRFINSSMKQRFNEFRQLYDLYKDSDDTITKESLRSRLNFFFLSRVNDNKQRIIFSENPERMDLGDPESLLMAPIPEEAMGFSEKDVWIDNLIPSEVLDLLQSSMNQNYKELLAYKRYDMEVLSEVRDFRTLVNLLYVNSVAKEMGISTRLDPVLSFPLGANSITILEAALSYDTMITGNRFLMSEGWDPEMVPVITKILDRDNETIWESRPLVKKVLKEEISGSIAEILRMVMENGTGRAAKGAVQLSMEFENGRMDIPIPLFGKTGTANRFTNSSFVGFVPGMKTETGGFDLDEGYVIASYVGYDDNRSMKGRHFTVYGASGALPLWIETSDAVVNSGGYRHGLQEADLIFGAQAAAPVLEGLDPVKISPVTGLPIPEKETDSEPGVTIYSDLDRNGARIVPKRLFQPWAGVNNDK